MTEKEKARNIQDQYNDVLLMEKAKENTEKIHEYCLKCMDAINEVLNTLSFSDAFKLACIQEHVWVFQEYRNHMNE